MRDRFWLVLGLLLILVIAGFASLGTRGGVAHGQRARLSDMMAELPGKLFGDLRDMTASLAESMNGTPHNTADGPETQKQ